MEVSLHTEKPQKLIIFLVRLSKFSAGHGGIRAIMDDMKLLSTEAEGVREAIPEESRRSLVNSSERVGALLGLQDQREDNSDQSADSSGTSF